MKGQEIILQGYTHEALPVNKGQKYVIYVSKNDVQTCK